MVSPKGRAESALAESFPTAAAAVFQLHADGRFEFERFIAPNAPEAGGA
jgi:hypothetical protein